MSWTASGYVKTMPSQFGTNRLTCAHKCLLYTLADYYDDESQKAWPTLTRLSHESLLSERQTMRLLKDLSAWGVLQIGKWRTKDGVERNYYRFTQLATKGDKLTGTPKGVGDMNRGVGDTVGGVPDIAMSPKQSIETINRNNQSLTTSSHDEAAGESAKPKKSSSKRSVSDEEITARHSFAHKLFEELYMEHNKCPRSQVPWGGKYAARLTKMLKDHPGWDKPFLESCIRNYFKSDQNLAADPFDWMFTSRFVSLRNNSVDRYWRPLGADHYDESEDLEQQRKMLAGEDF